MEPPVHPSAARQRILPLALAVAVGLVLATPQLALAHLHLRRSAPTARAVLDTVPREIRLVFTEAPQAAVSSIRLLAAGGAEVELGAPFIDPDSATSLVVRIPVEALSQGAYTVVWRTASADGHPMQGRFDFTIAAGAIGLAAAAAPEVPSVDSAPAARESLSAPSGATAEQSAELDIESPAYVAIRWLGYAALFGLIGAVALVLFVAPGAPSIEADVVRAAARVAVVAATVLVLAWVARLVAQSLAMNAGIAAILEGTTWGHAWILGAAASLVALGASVAARQADSRAGWYMAAIATLAASVALPLSGHAVAAPRLGTLAVTADAAHILGAGGWLGTLLVTIIAGIPVTLRGEPGTRGKEASKLINAFSPMALGCATLLVVTGVIAAWLHLGSLPELWQSRYGQVLLIKLAVIIVLVSVAGANWRIFRPALGSDDATRRIRRSAIAELVIATLVLAVTAVLVATPPPTEAAVASLPVTPPASAR
jgi:copper transport protein